MILGKVADLDVGSPGKAPSIGLEDSGEDLQERGFSDAGFANDADTLAPAHEDLDLIEHFACTEGLCEIFCSKDIFPGLAAQPKVEKRGASARRLALEDLDLFDLLEARLGLFGLGRLGPEAFHEGAL